MGRIQKNDNFIDKTFTIVADILLKVFPASKQEKEAHHRVFNFVSDWAAVKRPEKDAVRANEMFHLHLGSLV